MSIVRNVLLGATALGLVSLSFTAAESHPHQSVRSGQTPGDTSASRSREAFERMLVNLSLIHI